MQAKPTTTYHRASTRSWELIRAAYLSGLSAPALAARFGVSEGAIRKRAGRDGWTKRAYAETLDPPAFPAPAPASTAAAAPLPDPRPDAWTGLNAAVPPVRYHPTALARQALRDAAQALGDGRADDARKLASACEALVRLDQAVPLAGDHNDDPRIEEARQALLRDAVFEMAIELSEKLVRGQPLPPAYADLHARLLAQRAAQGCTPPP